MKALNNKNPPELSEEDEVLDIRPSTTLDALKKEESVSRQGSPMETERGESIAPEDGQRRKNLVIRRKVNFPSVSIRIGLT